MGADSEAAQQADAGLRVASRRSPTFRFCRVSLWARNSYAFPSASLMVTRPSAWSTLTTSPATFSLAPACAFGSQVGCLACPIAEPPQSMPAAIMPATTARRMSIVHLPLVVVLRNVINRAGRRAHGGSRASSDGCAGRGPAGTDGQGEQRSRDSRSHDVLCHLSLL